MAHGDNQPALVTHNLILAPGGEADIPSPCCVWGKFAVVTLVRFRVDTPPAAGGGLESFRLLRDVNRRELVPGETKTVPSAQVAADLAAGVESRDERFMEGGAHGIRIRNTMNVKIVECIVEWRPYTLHNIER